MTNPQIERMAEALWNKHKLDMGDAWYDDDDQWKTLPEAGRIEFINTAQAAYDASDARLVPVLVEALNRVLNRAMVHDHEGYEEIAKQALAQLPKGYR